MALSAKHVAAIEKKRQEARKEYYKALLDQFCRKIKAAVERGERHAIVTVPTFLVGFPRYDLATTVQYMARQLQRLGYIVNLIGPLDIRVQWSAVKPEEELEIQEPDVFLPSLANLKKTAESLRKTPRK
jgi:hypothetical protein